MAPQKRSTPNHKAEPELHQLWKIVEDIVHLIFHYRKMGEKDEGRKRLVALFYRLIDTLDGYHRSPAEIKARTQNIILMMERRLAQIYGESLTGPAYITAIENALEMPIKFYLELTGEPVSSVKRVFRRLAISPSEVQILFGPKAAAREMLIKCLGHSSRRTVEKVAASRSRQKRMMVWWQDFDSRMIGLPKPSPGEDELFYDQELIAAHVLERVCHYPVFIVRNVLDTLKSNRSAHRKHYRLS